MNFDELNVAVHCFYNPQANKWAQYNWDSAIESYKYCVYSLQGQLEQGYSGHDAIMERHSKETWIFVGCL